MENEASEYGSRWQGIEIDDDVKAMRASNGYRLTKNAFVGADVMNIVRRGRRSEKP